MKLFNETKLNNEVGGLEFGVCVFEMEDMYLHRDGFGGGFLS